LIFLFYEVHKRETVRGDVLDFRCVKHAEAWQEADSEARLQFKAGLFVGRMKEREREREGKL
jgi:hypothetical protein